MMMSTSFSGGAEQPNLDRQNLLEYRNADRKIVQGSTLEHWDLRWKETQEGLKTIMGPLPGDEKRVSLQMDVESEIDCGSYVRRRILYSSEPNNRTPAFLLIPKVAFEEGAQIPAVLALHSTHWKLGSRVVVGLGGKYGRNYGEELAQRGYVVLAPDYPLMSTHKPDLKELGYISGSMKAVWDNIRGIDLLESLPFVRPGKVAVIGHSLGGHNAIFTAVHEPRVGVIVTSCGFDSFHDYMGDGRTAWGQECYMPEVLNYELEDIPFDFYQLTAALAPRPFFSIAPLHDGNFRWDSVQDIHKAITPIYKLHNAEHKLKAIYPDYGHDFPDESRAAAYEFIDKYMKNE